MACKDGVGRARARCVEWEQSQRARCDNWRTQWTQRCDQWRTEWTQRCDAWHTILLSRDASILLVENRDTGTGNSEYTPLSTHQRHRILAIAREAGFE